MPLSGMQLLVAMPLSDRRLLMAMPISEWVSNGGNATERVNECLVTNISINPTHNVQAYLVYLPIHTQSKHSYI